MSIIRIITDVSLSRDLSFGPTDQREVIIELIFTRSSTEHHGFIYLVMNSLIRDKEKHPWSSVIIRDKEKFENSQIRDIKKIRDSP